MRLEPLYRVRFRYPESYGVTLTGDRGNEAHYWFLAEGTVEGRIEGRMRAVNHPRARVDGCALPHIDGAYVTADGANIMVEMQGYARPYPADRRQIVVAVRHTAEDERYRWLNDVVCVGTGEIRPQEQGAGGPRKVHGHAVDFVIDVAELVWEPIAE
ncbi:MAG: DUF3237 domain-containing protein [Thermoleophilia bacterium]|jgi:hypothetical protein|nr:DUF3237 domain-containing protein [Thermoleophilia bacterium]